MVDGERWLQTTKCCKLARGAVNKCIMLLKGTQKSLSLIQLSSALKEQVVSVAVLMFDSLIKPPPLSRLCSQVCAVVSLLPSGSLADLTCEALLMLSGNVSRKSRANISCYRLLKQHSGPTWESHFSSRGRIDFQPFPFSRPRPLNAKPSTSIPTFSVWILGKCLFMLLRFCGDLTSLVIAAH